MTEEENPLVRIAEALERLALLAEGSANLAASSVHAENGKTTILYAANAPKGL